MPSGLDTAVVEFDAVVLAGGGGTRLGGVDKAGLVVGGVTLLDRVLAACADAGHTVVVGAQRPTVREVAWTRETPPGGGPLAGLIAGLARLAELGAGRTCPVVVLATDLPRLAAADVVRLLAALGDDDDDGDGGGGGEAEAAIFTDGTGRLQLMTAAYRRAPLRRALVQEGSGTGRPMRILAERLRLARLPDYGAAADVDTPDQLERHRLRADGTVGT